MFHVTGRCSTSERLCERPLFAPCAQEADEEIQKIIRSRSDDVGVSALGLAGSEWPNLPLPPAHAPLDFAEPSLISRVSVRAPRLTPRSPDQAVKTDAEKEAPAS